jgi:ABC-type uncharacterized transport system permease subunit
MDELTGFPTGPSNPIEDAKAWAETVPDEEPVTGHVEMRKSTSGSKRAAMRKKHRKGFKEYDPNRKEFVFWTSTKQSLLVKRVANRAATKRARQARKINR